MGELSIIFFVTYGLAELLLFFVYFEKNQCRGDGYFIIYGVHYVLRPTLKKFKQNGKKLFLPLNIFIGRTCDLSHCVT